MGTRSFATFLMLLVAGLTLPFIVGAQEWLNFVGGTLLLLDTYVFWSTIVLAAVAVGLVLHNASKMRGGVFGSALKLFGFGMALSLLGYLSTQYVQHVPGGLGDFLSDTFFILGYVLMAVAASKLAKAIG